VENTARLFNPPALIEKYRPIAWQVVKYALVGLWGVALHLAIIALCINLFGLPYWVGFIAALPFTYSSKFLLNKFWTFGGWKAWRGAPDTELAEARQTRP
jgi:putative flippase GtrA